ncbi:retinoblastoma-binding protein 5-like protein [Dinothrombium tinctorium]|uniref:Retinoblastoma-binding protein 5-like protein n=1 Tax=Dinothrombium tinctorium TaxID=1965070 RepID=A0A3S3SAS4_9ACAR|nr:retinoblastoma-binding protein 5-like protein [Dinothrombium tinctorium]
MNIELLQQFGQNYPEEFDGVLDCISLAVTCAFNRRGTLLAVGCNDGRIVIWDFLTRGIAKVISSHVHPVCSLSWSRYGTLLASASTDNTVCVWEVITSDCIGRWRLPSPILKVQFHPRNDKLILICPMKHPAIILYLSPSEEHTKTHTILPLDEDSDLNIIASFDRRGQHIYCGNSKGRIVVIKLDEKGMNPEIVASFRVSNMSIKQIEFAPKRKDCFLVNTMDRVIRVYSTEEVLTCGLNGEPEPIQKLQDLVNKTMWKKCCFSGGPDADYICAGSARQHSIYIWERSLGSLVKILHGTKGEMLLDVVWHPLRAIIASISSGVVSIWAQAQVENWSAFAPDFKELDENVEYEERESEFDIEDEDRSPTRGHQDKEDEDIEVDVDTIEPTQHYLSSDESEEDEEKSLVYLPVSLEIDEPENIDGSSLVNQHPNQNTSSPATPQKNARSVKAVDIELQNTSNEGSIKHMGHGGAVPPEKPIRGKTARPGGKRASMSTSSEMTNKRKKKVELYIPKPQLWEWWWCSSVLFSFIALKAIKKNNVSSMKTYAIATLSSAFLPLFYALGHYFNDVWVFWESRDIKKVSEVWQGYPVGVLWYFFLLVALQPGLCGGIKKIN